jgi:PKD repeat protein
MNRFTRFCITLGFLVGSVSAYSQSNQASHKCAANDVLENNMLQYPAIKAQQIDFQQQLKSYLDKNNATRAKVGEKRIIPVVFHVIHECGPENISKAQILDQIRILNEDYSLSNPNFSQTPQQFASLAADCNIEFRLATKDDLGNCTDGIVRVYSPKTNEANDANGVKSVSHWNSTKYLNVWVVKSIGSVQGTGGEVLGYAQFPFGGFLSTDGIVLRSDCVGSIGTAASGGQFGVRLGRTATHEVGHWLGLRHIWGDADCGSDGVDDTPIAQQPNYGICWDDFPYHTTSCGRLESDTIGEMFMNYMDYSDDQCMSMFTMGQGEVIDAILNFARPNMISSSNLIETGTTDEAIANAPVCAPSANFCENRFMVCSGASVAYTDASYNTENYTRSWEFDGGTPATSTAANPTVTYANAGVYKTKLTVTNSSGTTEFTKDQLITVSVDQADNAQGPFWDNMDSQSNFNDRYIQYNGDNSSTNKWEYSAWTGYGPDNSCIRMRNYNNTPTEIDAFITPSYNISSIPSPSMTFRIASAERGGSPGDILKFFTSTNCGQSWVLRKSWTGNALITAGYFSSEFAPTSTDQWQTYAVTLSSVASQSNVRFKFEFTAGDVGSNNLYLDDINIGTAVSINDIDAASAVSIYPNPANQSAALEFNINSPSNIQIRLFDMLGKQVLNPYAGNVNTGTQKLNIDLSSISAGIYTLQLQIDGNTINKKLIKN